MQILAKNLISYYRASVADVSKLAVDLNNTKGGPEIFLFARTDLYSGIIEHEQTEKIFTAARYANKLAQPTKQEQAGPTAIEVVLMPYIFSEKAYRAGKEPKRYPLICVPALLKDDGTLSPRINGITMPWIPREMLEPIDVSYQPTVGNLDEVNDFLNTHVTVCNTWQELVAFSESMVNTVTGLLSGNTKFVVTQGEGEAGVTVLADTSSFSVHIASLYKYLEENGVAAALSLAIANGSTVESPVGAVLQKNCFVGTMNTKHGLAWTQRISANHVTTCARGDVIAVNGPPGTGKTTLLAALIADSWSKAALAKQAYPPLVVVASTNNKAVTNVNDSLFSVAADHERWVTGVASLGLYLSNKGDAKYQRYDRTESFFTGIEDANWLALNKRAFIAHATNRFKRPIGDLATAQEAIHEALLKQHDLLMSAEKTLETICGATPNKSDIPSEIVASKIAAHEKTKASFVTQAAMLESDLTAFEAEAVDRIDAANIEMNSLRLLLDATRLAEKNENAISVAWLEHLAGESLWYSVAGFIPAVTARREMKRKLFWAKQQRTEKSFSKDKLATATKAAQIQDDLTVLTDIVASINAARRAEADKYSAAQARLSTLAAESQREFLATARLQVNLKVLGMSEISIDDCLQRIDATIRSVIFNLSMHYWEGRYLQELALKLADQNYDKAGIDKSRQARMFRRFAMLTPCFVATFNSLPKYFKVGQEYLLEEIDLLIAEEAGQIAPEVAFCSVALAKRLVAVGDIFQLEPVWNLPKSVDLGNARRMVGLQGDALTSFFEEGYAVSSGCMMKIAQNACAFRPNSTGPKGFTLTEHRRCVPEIIDYCNVLVYGGVLEPKRAATESKVRGYLPAMGWAHIAGNSERAGTSWANNDEALAIADWLVRNKERLEASYPAMALKDIIAIISPLKPQANLIAKRVRDRLGDSHSITIDSVHSLQGAERPVVIFSPGYGINHTKGIFYNNATNLMNVAVSRAKDAFLVFGNMNLLDPTRNSPLGVLGQCVFRSVENNVLDVYPAERKPKQGMAQDGTVQRISGRSEHLGMIQSMFGDAKERVIVASPFVTKSALTFNNAQLLSTVRETVGRGVSVLIYLDKDNLVNFRQSGKIDKETLQRLADTGASIFVTGKRFHNKTFCRDATALIEGSFNWLSAPRYDSGDKHECSTAYSGALAATWIDDFIGEMKLLQAEPLGSRVKDE